MPRADLIVSAVIPAGHQMRTRSPNGAGVVLTMTGSLPRLVWMRACTKPQRSLCAVMTHHIRPATGRGHGGLHTPAMTDAVVDSMDHLGVPPEQVHTEAFRL